MGHLLAVCSMRLAIIGFTPLISRFTNFIYLAYERIIKMNSKEIKWKKNITPKRSPPRDVYMLDRKHIQSWICPSKINKYCLAIVYLFLLLLLLASNECHTIYILVLVVVAAQQYVCMPVVNRYCPVQTEH